MDFFIRMFGSNLNKKPRICEADKDIELMRKVIKYMGYAKISRYLISGNLLAVAWGVSISKVSRMIDDMYDNVRSFNYDPYMNIIIGDYEAFRTGASADPGSPVIDRRSYQYDWSDFHERNVKMIAQLKHYKPEFINVATRKDRIKLYFEHRFIEKALLRFSMGEMSKRELEASRTIFEAFMLINPNPFK